MENPATDTTPPAPPEELSPERRLLLRRLLRERANQKRDDERVRPRSAVGPVPLSFAQQRLWFIQQLDPASSAYNMPFPLRLRGELDVPAMRRSVSEMMRRHESLRTVFAAAAGEPVQVVLPAAPARLPVADLSGLPGDAREAEARRLAVEESARPFDLARGPLMRASLLRLAADDWGLVFNLHHVVSDGWSMGVLTREVSALYDAFSRGLPSPLAPLAVQYPDYALWQRERISGEALEAQVRFWREALSGAPPVLELPLDRPRPSVPGQRAERRRFAASAAATAALRELAQEEGATLFITLLAAFQALLARWSGQEDVSVGTPTAGRGRLELEGVIGMFVNTLVLRTRVEGELTFRELLGRVRETTLGAFAHQDVPFEKLVEELRVERSLQHTPLFQVMFALQSDAEEGRLKLRGLRVEPLARAEEPAKFDLNASLVDSGDHVSGTVAFRTDLFDGATIDRLLEHFGNLLDGVAAHPDRRLAAVEILGAAEREQVVEAWNRTARPYPRGVCIHELFEAQVRERPGAPALVWGEVELTYAQLDARANRLAHHLRGLGVGPESRVGVLLERGVELVVAILAVLKAGGCYVPLDPGYPAERLRMMLDDSSVRVLLTRGDVAFAAEAGGVPVVLLDQAADALAGESAEAPRSGATAENLAYIVYTSGSTGRPKGVMVAHRHVVQLAVETDYVQLGPGDRVAQASNASFDALTFEAWGALMNGATLVGIPRDVLLSPAAFRQTLREQRITTLYQTTALLNQLSREQPDIFSPLREVLFGGQAADADSVRRLLRAGRPERLLHVYGPTETTAWCSYERVEQVADDALTVPVGRATGNQRIYLLDASLEPVPTGVTGEAYVGGDGVVRGYLDRPALTAERFLPDPFAVDAGTRMYRTGDRLRWKADGRLEFIGRVDEQVKVRGFRIEPGEIEAVLSAHAEVREARVIVREDEPGEQRLVAYVVGGADADALRDYLRRSLPEYMVPGGFVALESLPLTPNGKLDVRALPAPEYGAGEGRHVAPRTPTEEILAGIWADVLRRERVGVTEDFFALGGHSLLATQVVSRAAAALGVEIPLRALFEAPTVAGLAQRADAALREGAGMQAPPLVPVPREGAPLPLSFAQQRLWFIQRLEPESAAYNMPFPLRLRGSLDVAALRRSLGELVRRHEALRTVFRVEGGDPVQVIQPAVRRRLAVIDLEGLPEGVREAEARRLAGEDAARPFDLSRGPLLRVSLVRAGADDHVLLVNLHHVVGDGWSMGVLTREVSALYGAYSAGRPSPLAELPVQYADYAVWQRSWLVGATLERQIAYWRERLGGAPPLLELPTDHPRPAVASDRGSARGFALSAEATAGLRALSRREGATLFTTLLGGWAALLGRYAGEEDVVVGTPIAGRTRLETEGLIGFFVNTLVLRTDLSGEPGGGELVRRVRERVLEAHAHQDVPFERLVEELSVERSLAHAPLFQAMLAFGAARDEADALELGGVEVEPVRAAGGTEKFDLTLSVTDAGERLAGALSYRTELWEGATIERMLSHLAALLEGMAAEPGRPFTEIGLLPEAERTRVLTEWNATERAYPAGLRVHDLFAAQAARTPGAPAVSFRGESVTYAELDARSGRLANHLRGLGVGPETRVGVCLERTPELVVALLAVLRAGGAYVPLDPAYPRERLGWMQEDARVSLVLTSGALAGVLPAGTRALALDAVRARVDAEPSAVAESGVLPENLSHVIFTSGSTGRPKGVMIRHSSTVVLLHWLRENVSDEERSAMLFSTSINFDVSVAEVFGTLSWGGRLVLVENALELADLPAGEQVVHASMVPTAAAELLRAGGIPASVRTLNLGGEALPQSLAQGLYALGTVERVGNLYGPTEDTTYSTYSVVERGGERVLVGRPVANTRAYVLDRHLQPVPAGVAGELYLAGGKLARGYAARPDLTAERFLPDPFGEPGGRMYRVMDRVRRLASGELEYFGRTDFQVKVRGFRIELGEIEAVLGRHPAVRDAVAVVREDAAPGDRRIVAYATPAGDSPPDAAELRAHVGLHLPEYMVPTAVVVLASLPLSPNGKVDRRALPAPERAGDANAGGYLAPRDTLELALARIWEDVLGLERVGVRDGFFALGGHSLLAVRLMARVEQATGARLPLTALFTAPSVELLAGELRRGGARDDGSPLVPIRPGGSRPPLFLVHPVGGDVLAYAALARRLDPEQPVYGLRSRGLAPGAEPARTVEEMAADYLGVLREAQPAGPYRLGGWSMGGVVAFEMARRLEAAGERVERLVLVDSQVPALHGRALPDDEGVRMRIFAQDMGLSPEQLALVAGAADAGVDAGGRAYLGRVLEGARAAGLVPPELGAERIEQLYAVFRANLVALYGYWPGAWGGAATLLRAAEHDPAEAESAGWERLLEGGVEVRTVPGSHFTLVREPHAEALAREMERALEG